MATIGRADVEIHGDTRPFERDLKKLQDSADKIKDLTVKVQPALSKNFARDLQSLIDDASVKMRVTVTPVITKKAIQDLLNEMKTLPPQVRLQPVILKTAVQRVLDDAFPEDKPARVNITGRVLKSQIQSALNDVVGGDKAPIAYIKGFFIRAQLQKALNAVQPPLRIKVHADVERNSLIESLERQEDAAMRRLLQMRQALNAQVDREIEGMERRNKASLSLLGVTRELLRTSTRLNNVKFDNLNQLIGASIAGEALLTTLGNVFKSALNLRRVALQLGTAFATAFAAGAQAAGAMIGAVSVLLDGLGVLAGLGLIAVGIKFQLDDPDVKAASDRAAEIFKTTMTEASESLEPVLINFFDDFGVAIAKQKGALTDFFDTVSGPLDALGERFNNLLGSEKVGALIRRLGDSTGKFLDGIDPDAIFDASVKIADAFGVARDRIREAFGPGIFENASVDGFVAGLEGLTDALVSAGDGVKAFKRAFGQFVDGIKIGTRDILDTIGQVGPELFGALGPIAKQVAIDIGQIVSSLIEFAAVVLPKVEKNAKKFSDVFSDNLSKALDILAEPFAKTLDSILELGVLLSPLLPIFARIAAALEPIIGSVLEIAKILAPIAESFFDQLADILEFIKPALEFVERQLKRLRKFLEENPAIQSFLGRALAVVGLLILGFLFLRKLLLGLFGIFRRLGSLFKLIKNPLDAIRKIRDRRVKIEVESDAKEAVDKAIRELNRLDRNLARERKINIDIDSDIKEEVDRALDQLKRLDDALAKSRNINISIDLESDVESEVNKALDQLKRLDEAVAKKRTIEIEIDFESDIESEISKALAELRKLDEEIGKERVIKIRCEKIGDCECDEEDDDDDDRRRRRPRSPREPRRTPNPPKSPPLRPVPPAVNRSLEELERRSRDAGRALDDLGRRSSGLTGRLGGLGRVLGGLGRFFGPLGLAVVGAGAALGTFGEQVGRIPELLSELNTRVSEADGVLGKLGATLQFVLGESLNSVLSTFERILSTFGIDVDLTALFNSLMTAMKSVDWGAIAGAAKIALEEALNAALGLITINPLDLAGKIAEAIGKIDFGQVFGELKSDIQGFFSRIFDGINIDPPTIPVPDVSGAKGALDGLKSKIDEVKRAFADIFTIPGTAVPEGNSMALFGGGGGVPAAGGAGGISGLTAQLNSLLTTMETVRSGIETAASAIRLALTNMFSGLDLATVFGPLGTSITDGLRTAIDQGFSGASGSVSDKMTTLLGEGETAATTGMSGITTVVADGVGQITTAFDPLRQTIPQAVLDAMIAAITAATAGINGLVSAVAAGADAVASQASNYYDAGVQIGQRLAAGMDSQVDDVQAAAGRLAAAAAGNFNASPAKWGPLAGKGDMFYRGQEFVNRLIKGLLDRAPALREFAGQLAAQLDQFRNSDVGKSIEKFLAELSARISTSIEARRSTVGFGGGGVIGGPQQLTGPGGSNSGRILGYDRNAEISNVKGRSILQIRPGQININVPGVNDPRVFIESLSKELITACTAR